MHRDLEKEPLVLCRGLWRMFRGMMHIFWKTDGEACLASSVALLGKSLILNKSNTHLVLHIVGEKQLWLLL